MGEGVGIPSPGGLRRSTLADVVVEPFGDVEIEDRGGEAGGEAEAGVQRVAHGDSIVAGPAEERLEGLDAYLGRPWLGISGGRANTRP